MIPVSENTDIERFAREIQANPGNSMAWRALATWITRATRRHGHENTFESSLQTAFEPWTESSFALYAFAVVKVTQGQQASADSLLVRAAAAKPESPEPDLLLARLCDRSGDGERAATHYLAALDRQPGLWSALMGLGYVRHRQARYPDAVEAFRRATELRPEAAEGWTNLAVALAASGAEAASVDPARRASVLAPDSASIQSNFGDTLMGNGQFAHAIDPYRRANELEPDNPTTLNKLSCAERALGELEEPERLLRRALTLAPDFDLALLNLGVLETIKHDYAAATALLDRALALADVTAKVREDISDARATVDEHRRLHPAILRAVERNDSAELYPAVAATTADRLHVDDEYLSRLDELARGLRQYDGQDEWPALDTRPPSWAAFEAHFSCHAGDGLEDLRTNIAWLASPDRKMPTDRRAARAAEDLIRIERAVRERRAMTDMPSNGGAEWETCIRFSHAVLTWHRPECVPGQFKPLRNLTGDAPSYRLVSARATAGSLRAFFTKIYPSMPPGVARAILVLRAIGSCHPFVDGNGRIARFLFSGELERAGFRPIVISTHLRRHYVEAVAASRIHHRPDELVAFAIEAMRETASIVESVGGRVG